MSLTFLPLFDLDAGFSVVDVETTGHASRNGHIIEIGMVHVHHRRITDSYHSLVRPPVRLQPFITSLTGITDEDLESAPPFSDIAHAVESFLKDHFFVAHNAAFDYGFLKTEFGRLGRSFYSERFCTVKLSRKLFPGHRQYNLDSMIDRLNISCANRHRALGDAAATAEILIKLLEQPEAEKVFLKFAQAQEKKDRWTERLASNIQQLPSACGVYFFEDINGLPLYIGKSNNVHSRVLSHLREDDIPKKKRLLRYTDRITHQLCGSELEALILESRLIKKHQPFYNVQQVHRKGQAFVKITRDDYPKMLMVETHEADGDTYIGPFRSAKFLEYLLDKVQRHLKLCPELMKPKRNKKGFCFFYQLDGCSGACGGAIDSESYRQHIEEAKEILEYYTRMDSKDNIGTFLKSRALKHPEMKGLSDALKRERQRMAESPDIYADRCLVVDHDNRVTYLIVGGLLEKVFREDERPEPETVFAPTETRIRDDENALDERETIQRYIRSHRAKLRIVALQPVKDATHAHLS